MNFYNPYFSAIPYVNGGMNVARTGLLSRIFGGGLNLSSILSGTQRTLNFANQAIPLIRQVQPMMKNAKTMFKIMNEFKKVDTPTTTNTNQNDYVSKIDDVDTSTNYNYGPTFFQ